MQLSGKRKLTIVIVLSGEQQRMSVSPGYNHISVRNAQKRAVQAKMLRPEYARLGSQGFPKRNGREEDTAAVVAPTGVPGPQAVTKDTQARGFVIYVGLDEEAAAGHNTTLSQLAAQIRREISGLVPSAKTHAAVALAPASAKGNDLDVVRLVLGDPTVARPSRPEPAAQQNAASHSGVLIDLSRREVQLDGEVLNLTFKEFELLNYLVENADKTVSRDELLSTLWRNTDEIPNERTIDVHIRRLRAKLGRLSNTVRTVRGQGYRFYEHPEVVVWAAPEYTI